MGRVDLGCFLPTELAFHDGTREPFFCSRARKTNWHPRTTTMEDESTLDLLEEINTLRTENRYYKEQLALALSKIKDLRKVCSQWSLHLTL